MTVYVLLFNNGGEDEYLGVFRTFDEAQVEFDERAESSYDEDYLEIRSVTI